MRPLLFLFFVCTISVNNAQVMINEYSCSNMTGITDASGNNSDWAEFYNAGTTAFDLGGYFLSDKESNLSKWEIPIGPSIPAGGYIRVFFNGEGTFASGDINAGFKLTQTKNEYIILTSPGGSVIDSLRMVKMTQKDHSLARMTDGASIWGIDQSPTPGASNATVDNYYTAKPILSLSPGFYTGSQTVTATTADATASLYYTTDGSVPTTGSTPVTGPINISSTTVLRVRAFSSDASTPASFIETNTYFIDITHSVPVLSVCGDQIMDFLNDVAPGSFSSNFDGAFEYFEADGSFIDEGEGYYNKHGNDSWAYDQRGFDLIVRDEYGYNHSVNHEIFQEKDRDEYQRLIVKAAANDNYSFEDGAHIRDAYIHTLSQLADLRVDERTAKMGVVYVDGEYWGVYDFREKVDDADFTEHYYDQPGEEIDFIKTWGGTWAEYGDMTDWNDLYTYITTNDMSVTANYEYVKSQYNVGSLIDYVVLNSFIVSSDWLNWNTAWWRGKNPDGDKKKWRYVLWDLDATFGHYINYTGVPSTAPDADPCNPETLSGSSDPEGHITILNKLMENEEFKQEYITRYADLANGYFSCEQMIHVLDSMVAVIDPEMPAQCAKWGGTYTEWQDNVQSLRDFINDRCAAISAGMIDCYDLTGPFDLVVNVDPPFSGRVKVNSEWVPYYSWTGVYYGNINTLFKADAYAGYEFAYWESINHTFNYPDSLNDTLDLMSADSVIAHFIYTPIVDPEGPPLANYDGFHMPTGFSPNNDGKNDVLQFYVGYDVEQFELMIFDRWGNLVFQTQTNGDYWDGYYKGQLLNTGVYTYTLNYTLTDVGTQKKTGNITLIR